MNSGDVYYAHTDLAIEGVGEGSTDISEEAREEWVPYYVPFVNNDMNYCTKKTL